MLKGIIYTIISSLSISLMGIFIKEIGTELSNSTILFSRFLFSFIVILPIALKDKDFLFKVNKPILLIVRCCVGLAAMSLFFYSIQRVPLANVMLLQNTRPIFVPLLLLLFIGEKTDKKVLTAIIISFIGIAIIINPGAEGFNPISVLALLSGLLSATAITFLQFFIKANNNRSKEALFYYFLFSTIATFIIMAFNWKTPTSYQLILLLFVGLFGTLFQIFMTFSLKYLSVKIVAPLMYFSVIFSGLLDLTVFHQKTKLLAIAGIIIAITGSVMIILFDKKSK